VLLSKNSYFKKLKVWFEFVGETNYSTSQQ